MPDPDPKDIVYQTTCVGCEKEFTFREADAEFAGAVMKSKLALPAPMVVRCPKCGEPNQIDFGGIK